jgi:hypothetical protein
VRERLVRRGHAPGGAAAHYLVETGGLWQLVVEPGAYYEAADACSSTRVAAGSILTPGPMVELLVTALT